MKHAERLFVWAEGTELVDGGLFGPASEAQSLLVADSWLVEQGRVRALDGHRQRFTAGCVAVGLGAAAVTAFWAAAVRRVWLGRLPEPLP